jgi:uncharacterized membrane protein
MKLLQVHWVMTEVADETRAAIRQYFPKAGAYLRAGAPVLAAVPAVVRLPPSGRWRRRAPLGVVQGVDHQRLAASYDCVLRLLVRTGEYVPAEGAVIAAHGGIPPRRAAAARISLGRDRTLYQDPAFGIRQLVDQERKAGVQTRRAAPLAASASQGISGDAARPGPLGPG